MRRHRFGSTGVSTTHLSRTSLAALIACLAVAAACGDAPTGTPDTSPFIRSPVALAASIALDDARDRILPALDDRGYAETLRGPLGELGATLAANDSHGARAALASVRHLLASRRRVAADAELSALELAVDGAAATIPLR